MRPRIGEGCVWGVEEASLRIREGIGVVMARVYRGLSGDTNTCIISEHTTVYYIVMPQYSSKRLNRLTRAQVQ